MFEQVHTAVERFKTRNEVKVGLALAETVGLSNSFTVEQVREAIATSNGRPKNDGWVYRVLDSMEEKGLVIPNFDASPITYHATVDLQHLIEAQE